MNDEELGRVCWFAYGQCPDSRHSEKLRALGARARALLAKPVATEVDPDAEAKRLAWVHWKGMYPETSCANKDVLWNGFSEDTRNGWRAVASAKKEAGGE